MKKRMFGYNLVELMLALVVLGLLLGAAVVPLQARYQAENRKDAERAMEDARQAVEGYAVINRTVKRRLIGVNTINYVLPAGRPYLPCPDITGNGLEDRMTVAAAAQVVILTMTVLTSEGACVEQKGLLPWRTLGLQEGADPWGRRFGYWVDVAFSNEILGFDETFRADIFDPRLPPIAIPPTPPPTTPENFRYATRGERDIAGALVCSQLLAGTTGGCPATDNQHFLIAGIVSPISLTIDNGVRVVPAYADSSGVAPVQGILDGAAFVVFSHGKNGYGGITRNNRCLGMPPDTNGLGERANAFYRAPHPMLAAPFSCAELVHDELAENLFVSAPRSSLQDGADDIVAWTSPNMLVGLLLRSGALPVPKLEFLPGAGR